MPVDRVNEVVPQLISTGGSPSPGFSTTSAPPRPHGCSRTRKGARFARCIGGLPPGPPDDHCHPSKELR